MFTSPTKGQLSFDDMFEEILGFMREVPDADYKLIIGSDSQDHDRVCFVTALVVHRQGKGGRYFYRKQMDSHVNSLRQKIFYETSLSLNLASKVAEKLSQMGHPELNVEIHCDVGPNGETKDLIREIVGMVTGSGFDAKIKPDSFGASKVADKHTK